MNTLVKELAELLGKEFLRADRPVWTLSKTDKYLFLYELDGVYYLSFRHFNPEATDLVSVDIWHSSKEGMNGFLKGMIAGIQNERSDR